MQSKDQSGLKPISEQEHRRREQEKEIDIRNLKKKLSDTYQAWETYWLELEAIDKTHILHTLHYDHTVEAAYAAYSEAKRNHEDIPPLDERMLILLKQYEDLEKQLHDKEHEIIPPVKLEAHEDHDVIHHDHDPEYLDHDGRYQDLIDANPLVVQLRADHPELGTISSIAELEAGVFALNPELIPHLQALDPNFDAFLFSEDLRGKFRELDPKSADKFDEAENHRIYQDPNLDPAVERMKRRIHDGETKINGEESILVLPRRVIENNRQQKKDKLIDEEFIRFAQDFPQKTAMYAEGTPRLANTKFILDQQQTAAPIITTSTYPDQLKRNMENLPRIPILIPQQPPLQPYDRSSMLRAPASARSVPSNEEPPESSSTKIPPRNTRPQNKKKNAASSTVQNLQNLQKLAQLVSTFFPPLQGVKAFALLLLFVVVIILVIAFMIMGGESKNPDGTYPVSITKVGPSEVPNPKEQDITKPDDSDITYKIDVRYAGDADTIVVTDSLRDNVTFVKAAGSGNPTYDEKTRTVTWNIKPKSAQSIIPPLIGKVISQQVYAQTNEKETSGTIHNLGFGPSNAERMENMIKAIRPESPFLGHGQEMIDLAEEFNVDPLMIIITMKESQLCSDNGLNSPGGSDPDNFNCGNITWEAAQDFTDIQRWHAKEGVTTDGHIFTYVPSMKDGLGLFYEYISSPIYTGQSLAQFYDVYNPCSDPANQTQGYACGAKEADEMLQLLTDYAGEPCTGDNCSLGSPPSGSSFGSIGTLSLTVRPKSEDTWVVNQAFAKVLGAKAPTNDNPSENPTGSQSNNAFVKVAEDIKAAYDVCAAKDNRPNGDTHEREGLPRCLHDALVKLSYSEANISAFEARRQNSLVDSPLGQGKCTQCLGYVGTVAALSSGSTSDTGLFYSNYASDYYNKPEGLDVGNDHYQYVGNGLDAEVKAGDIFVSNAGVAGHIGIVREPVEDSDTHFYFIESNGDVDCRVDIIRSYEGGGSLPKDGLNFYRKE